MNILNIADYLGFEYTKTDVSRHKRRGIGVTRSSKKQSKKSLRQTRKSRRINRKE